MAKRRPKLSSVLILRLSPTLHDALRLLAESREQTASEVVRGLVRKEVAKGGAA